LKDAEFVTWANNRIGRNLVGCSDTAVRDLRIALVASGEIEHHPKLQGADGHWYENPSPNRPRQSPSAKPNVTGSVNIQPTARKTPAVAAHHAAIEAISAAADFLTSEP
ncbi:MAG TPA: hypothetical protein VGE52_01585, partial [Pirellulales bacterium]